MNNDVEKTSYVYTRKIVDSNKQDNRILRFEREKKLSQTKRLLIFIGPFYILIVFFNFCSIRTLRTRRGEIFKTSPRAILSYTRRAWAHVEGCGKWFCDINSHRTQKRTQKSHTSGFSFPIAPPRPETREENLMSNLWKKSVRGKAKERRLEQKDRQTERNFRDLYCWFLCPPPVSFRG